MTDALPQIGEAREPDPIPFAEFLETVPPGQRRDVSDLCFAAKPNFSSRHLKTPQLTLHCTSTVCNGPRFFRYDEGDRSFERQSHTFLRFTCSNCQTSGKSFALQVRAKDLNDTSGSVYKYGELPAFGPVTPTRLLKLLGDQREIFLKGRRCENQGLGIGAFSYYRRVVEHQKNRIFGRNHKSL